MDGHEFSTMDKNKSAFKLKGLPTIYWLNLDADENRRFYMEEQFKYWQVENSWSDEGPTKGYYMMADTWFDEYVYEIAINKKYMDDNEINLFKNETNIKELPPWDPMGSLA